MDHVLTDTDVILDFFFDRPPWSEHASGIFALCESGRISGYVTPVIMGNAYYLLRRNAGHARVIKKLSQLLLLVDVLAMDSRVVRTGNPQPGTAHCPLPTAY